MDTSKTYIKMCREAKKIQGMWKPAWGDFMYDDEFMDKVVVTNIRNQVYKEENVNRRREDIVWLPQQDQLQEMIGLYYVAKIWKYDDNTYGMDVFKYNENIFWESPDFTMSEAGSMEQLWLAYVIQEKYNKRWTGETWEEIK